MNRDHVAYPPVAVLALSRTDFISRLEKSFDDWHTTPLRASLFGSAARGNGADETEIDIFLVRASRNPRA